jgi:hypothetical protein
LHYINLRPLRIMSVTVVLLLSVFARLAMADIYYCDNLIYSLDDPLCVGGDCPCPNTICSGYEYMLHETMRMWMIVDPGSKICYDPCEDASSPIYDDYWICDRKYCQEVSCVIRSPITQQYHKCP